MARCSGRPPAYRRRIIRGREVAYVTLLDQATGRRRDYWLGAYGSPESRARYARLLAAWEAAGRAPPAAVGPRRPADGATVTALMAGYWPTLEARVSPRHRDNVRPMLRRFRAHFGREPAAAIGPALLRQWRQAVASETSVGTAARHAAAILAMYRWAVANELVPVEVYQRLKTIEPLRRGPKRRIGPAPTDAMAAVRARVSAQVRAMIDLQLLTGMRPGEVCGIRPCDLDMSGPIWLYRPAKHKTAHHGHERVVYLGPQAQAVLRPLLADRAATTYCFSPAEALAALRAARHAARKTPISCGNAPGTNCRASPRRKPGSAYTVGAYRTAVVRACQAAGVARWHPHQLRHNYATEVRRRYGLEAARVLLGHCSALVTEAVYAERDQQAAMRVAAEIG